MGEQTLCIITGCTEPGTKHMKIDIGPTAGDAIVAESARKHDVLICNTHHEQLSPKAEHFSLGTDSVKRNVFDQNG